MNDFNDSPLNLKFDAFDMQHTNWTYRDYQLFATNTGDNPPEELNKLLKEETNWKFDHGQNVVASFEGPQGKGKSMPSSSFGLFLGGVYNYKFTPEDIYFLPEDLDAALSKAEPRQTFMRDEHLYSRVGIMSHMVNDNLADYEEQLRINQNNLLFCSVQLQNHAHFLCFEAKHTVWTEKNGKKYPKLFYAMLSTPRYTDRKSFVWRGFVSFKMPPEDFTDAYDKRKRQHIENLKNKYGDTLKQVPYEAKKLFDEQENKLIKVTVNGIVKPVPAIRIMKVIKDNIGTRYYTKEGYLHLIEEIKMLIESKYDDENEKIIDKTIVLNNERKKRIEEKKQEYVLEIEERKKQKEVIEKQKLIELQKKNELKKQLIEIKEREIEFKKLKLEKQ